MVIASPSMPSALPGNGDAVPHAELAARIASGPGLSTDWLAELGRQGLLEELLADGVIARALREAPTGHRYDRVLNAKMTLICVLVACLFPGAGYDTVLATASGLPGLRFRPGTEVPTGAAFSQARNPIWPPLDPMARPRSFPPESCTPRSTSSRPSSLF